VFCSRQVITVREEACSNARNHKPCYRSQFEDLTGFAVTVNTTQIARMPPATGKSLWGARHHCLSSMHVLIWSARQMHCFQLQQGQACLTIFELPARKQAKAL
jgi:hypothetical protein